MIDFTKEEKEIARSIERGVNKALEYLKKKIDEKTPEDTFTLIGNNDIEKAIQTGTSIKGSVYNNTEYAQYVEYGVMSKTYNYYKNAGRRGGRAPFYSGIGARMFTKSADEEEQEIYNIINKSL